jgi:predicted DsbA family dithiol-disulfide isomerase
VKIEIWADLVCPWCYLGKTRLDAALAELPEGEAPEVIYRSFELDPGASTRPTLALPQMLAEKYGGSLAGAQQMIDQVTRLAAADGLTFRLDLARPERTFDAHRLLHFAREQGLQAPLVERLFRAYFTEGRRLADRAELARLAAEAGLAEKEAAEVLSDPEQYADAVRADLWAAHSLGVTGVPFVVLDGRYAISGAQPVSAFREALARVRESRPGVT